MASSAAAGFLSRGNSGNASNMRGLVQFIADLRNARARELEEKRINKELANIRCVLLLGLRKSKCGTNGCFLSQAEIQRYARMFALMDFLTDSKYRWKSQWLPQEEIRVQGKLPLKGVESSR